MPKRFYFPLILVIFLIVAYFPIFSAGFIWDDFPALHKNPFLTGWDGLVGIWTTTGQVPNESHYWPVIYTSYWVQHGLWGLNPLGFHLVNLVLHGVNAWLLYLLLRRVGFRGSEWVALLFALHPVQVESVAWIHSHKNLISTLFGFGVLFCYLELDEDREVSPVKRVGLLAGMVCFQVLAMLSKTSAIVFPFAAALLTWWRTARVSSLASIRLGVLFAVTFALAGVDLVTARSSESVDFGFSLVQRGLLIAENLGHYLQKLVIPWPLTSYYPYTPPDTQSLFAWGCVVGWVLVVGVGLYCLKCFGNRGLLAGVLLFLLAHGPTSGVIDFAFMGQSLIADRYQYIPSIGLFLLAVAGAGMLIDRRPDIGKAVCSAGVVGLVCLVVLTNIQTGIYQDSRTIFTHALKNHPDSIEALNNLAAQEIRDGNDTEAEKLLVKVIDLKPYNLDALSNLGQLYARTGEVELAINHQRMALKAGSEWVETRNNLAWHLATTSDDRLRDGNEALRLALEANELSGGESPEVLSTLAAAYAETGDFELAVKYSQQAVKLAREADQEPLAKAIELTLVVFEQGKPWRE